MNTSLQKVGDLNFKEVPRTEGDILFVHHSELGSITVLDRMTGFGWRDIESGFRAPDGCHWIATGGFDIRNFSELSISDAIDLIKVNANTCVDVLSHRPAAQGEES